jgi:tetratricopeptide (TPR) repeat protein
MSDQDKSFEKMGQNFQKAFGYSSNGHYQQSIPLYEKAIQQDKNNFAALNNIAVARIYIAIEKCDKTLIENAISDLKEAIRITKEVYNYKDGYPIAEANLNWAETELNKLI